MKGWLIQYGALCERRPWWVALGVALALGWGVMSASRLTFEGSLLAMLPQDAAELEGRDDMLAQVPSGTELLLAVRGDAAQVEGFVTDVERALTDSGQVTGVYARLPVGFWAERWLYLLPLARLSAMRAALSAVVGDGASPPTPGAWAAAARLLEDTQPLRGWPISLDDQGRWLSQDGQRMVLIEPNVALGDMAAMPPTLNAIQQVIAARAAAHPGVSVTLGGRLAVIVDEFARLQRGMTLATAASFVLIVGFLWLTLGGGWALPMVALPLLAGAALGVGLVAATVGRLNLLSAFMFPVLLGLGVDMCIHLQHRWRSGDEAVRDIVGALWWPCAASTLTTVAAFGALGLSDFPGIAEFGASAALGMLAMQLGIFGVWPLLAAFAGPKRAALKPKLNPNPKALAPAWTRRAALAALCAGAALALFAALGLPRLRFENDLAALAGRSQATQDDAAVTAAVGRALDPTIWMTTTLTDARALSDHMRAQPDIFGASLSIADVLPQDPTESARLLALMHADLQRLRALTKTLTDDQRALLTRGLALTAAQPWGVEDVPPFWRARLQAKDKKRWLVYGWGKAPHTTEQEAAAWAAHVNATTAAAHDKDKVHVLDEGRVIARMFGLMRQNVWPMLGAAVGGVLLMLIGFRARRGWQSVWTTAAALGAGMCTTLGLMGWMGWPLQFYNMAALPILLGVGIDTALHLQHGRDERGPSQTPLVLRHQGYAALLAAITSAIGFGALALAAHPGVASLGWLAVLGMFSTALFTLIVIPAWWVWTDPR